MSQENTDLSNELNKLRIDKSKRAAVGAPRGRYLGRLVRILVLLIAAAGGGYALLLPSHALAVDTIRPPLEPPSDSAVLVATGYVVAHHKIQVGSKISGRVSWIGVEKGDRVRQDQVVVRLEDRE